MGKTTAGLPLTSGQHYEKCPRCATVYRTKRITRFRCPSCHALAYAVSTPKLEPGHRRTLEGDDQGRVFRILDARPAGEAPTYGSDVVLFLEDPDAAAPAPDARPTRSRPGGKPGPATDPEVAARRDRDRGPRPTGVRALWSGSLGDVFRRG